MPLLHSTLVEVHREYEKAKRATKDMVEACKRATMAADRLQEQCSKNQVDNTDLSAKV